MTPAQTPPRLITLILLTAFSTVSLNMFLPSLASIAEDLDASYSTVSLAVAGYLAVTAVIQLIVGPLSDRIGRRPVLLGSILLFTGASIVCSLATDVWTFLAFRMLQGGIISGYALSLAIVRDTTPERQAAALIGYISMVMAIAPMLGPVLGGALDTFFGWRANFYLYAAVGMMMFVVCWIDLGETRPTSTASSNGSRPVRVTDLLQEPIFWIYAFCTAFSTGSFFIFITGAPLVAQAQFEVSTAQLGVFIGMITAGFMTGSFLASRLAPHMQPLSVMLLGRLVGCFGPIAAMVAVQSGDVPPLLYFGCVVFVGLGNGLTKPSSAAATMSVRPGLAGSAAGVSGALVVACGAVLTSLTGILLPEENPAFALQALIFAASFAGLLTVFLAMRLNARIAANPAP